MYLDAGGGAAVVVGTPLPSRVEVFVPLTARGAAVFVVGELDLVVSTRKRAEIHFTANWLTSRFLETNAMEAGVSRDVGDD